MRVVTSAIWRHDCVDEVHNSWWRVQNWLVHWSVVQSSHCATPKALYWCLRVDSWPHHRPKTFRSTPRSKSPSVQRRVFLPVAQPCALPWPKQYGSKGPCCWHTFAVQQLAHKAACEGSYMGSSNCQSIGHGMGWPLRWFLLALCLGRVYERMVKSRGYTLLAYHWFIHSVWSSRPLQSRL